MTTTLEQVARAIAIDLEWPPESDQWRIYMATARAAVEAMREPSREVRCSLALLSLAPVDQETIDAVWENAIDAILVESGQ